MFVRQTTTSNSASGESYFTYRLVASERVGKQVRQRTKLNLGRHFTLPKSEWPLLCRRLESLLSGQHELFQEPVSATVETLAQRYYAQLVVRSAEAPLAASVPSAQATSTPGGDPPLAGEYQEVDVASLELVRPRSVGVEHVGLAMLTRLGVPEILATAGLNGLQRCCALGSIIGRLAGEVSELATWRWLQERSALGELLELDFEGVALSQLYRVSDLLVRHQEQIEQQLFTRLTDLFSLPTTVTLYDLTNTFFEGELTGNAKATPGHSKEKRSDCPLVTLGLVLDGSGFIRRSRTFAGNVAEAGTLEGMLAGLNAPKKATVIMDRGIATTDNVAWLIEHGYRYLVVSRERERRFDETLPVAETTTASGEVLRLQRVLSPDGAEVRLYCASDARAEKERGIADRFLARFEEGLAVIAAALHKPRGEKRLTQVWEKIGRLKQRSHGMGQHYIITVTPDEGGTKAVGLTWERTPIAGTLVTHPGVYCLRTNELTWDEATLWQTYTMLTDLEAVFRCLKSELGLRPVYHHKEARSDGHLLITVLAYQVIQAIRRQLREQGQTISWTGLQEILSVQQRVTATFRQRDGRTLHIRKATVAEPKLREIYDVLGVTASPGGTKKMIL